MTGIIGYFIALASTALIGVTVTALIKDERIRMIIQTMVGVLLLLVILKPISVIDPEALAQQIGEAFQEEFQMTDYETLYQDKLRQQVASTTEGYIQKKAESIGATLSAQVEVCDSGYPSPEKVRISGILTGEQRRILQDYITQEIGIPMENQRWELYE